MILHIVLYQPKATASREELLALVNALEGASREIPSIRQVRVGKAVDFGFTYETWPKDKNDGNVAIFEFDDLNGLQAYLAHESHKKLAGMFWRTCDQPTIIDVSAVDPRADELAAIFGQIAD